MSAGVEAGGIGDLPRVVPIFPLPGVVLLPRGRLPLNIFEPRYLEMTQDAMASHRTIGMIQPADPKARLDAPEVYPIGCLGRITSFSETPDNRFLITLSGVCRFAVARELEPDGLLYRRVRADYGPFAGDLPPPAPLSVDRGPPDPGAQVLFRAPRAHRRLGGDRARRRRCAGHLPGDGLPLRAEREAGAARMPGRGRAGAHDAGAVRDGGLRAGRPAAAHAVREDAAMAEEGAGVDPKLLEILVCPLTKEPLRYDAARQELISVAARLAFPIRDGIPIMLPDEARPLEEDEAR